MKSGSLDEIWKAGRLELPFRSGLITTQGHDPVYPTRFPIGELGASIMGAVAGAASALADLRGLSTGPAQVAVDEAAANLSGLLVDRLDGRPLPRPDFENPTIGMYECREGWVFLVGSLPELKRGTLDLLGCSDTKSGVTQALKKWDAFELENEIIRRGLAGAAVRTYDEWRNSEHGAIVEDLPAIELLQVGDAEPRPWPSAGPMPLSNLRVLEFARILAGPVAGRTLASLGADVLNLTTPRLPNFTACEVNTGIGKRHADVDIATPEGRAVAEQLLASADVLVDSHRSGGLRAYGLDAVAVAERHPGIVVTSLNAYGHTGPWEGRRGFEQMAQVSTGVAVEEGSTTFPQALPAGAPLDYCTGFLGAFGALSGLIKQRTEGGSWWSRVSLAQTASWLQRLPRVEIGSDYTAPTWLAGGDEHPLQNELESVSNIETLSGWTTNVISSFGRLSHLRPPQQFDGIGPLGWSYPPSHPGTHQPKWL